jgi:TolB-like protein
MALFSELKRRNVLRMAVLYVVAAWLVMQVAEVLTGLVNLPDWLGPTLLVLLAIGFPIALIFSWFFEITPEGLSLEKDLAVGQSITRATGRRMDFVVIAVLSAGLILFAWDKWWPRGPEELSIAVLPFENMSADPEQEYFSDGISEEILNLLAQIQPLKVIARTSSFSFKDKDVAIATMAEQLNVRHVLEGSVRRSGDRVRITAQLIDARDSSHLWSQTYDRDYDAENLFYVQSEIARAVTEGLRMTLTGEDEARLANVPTKNTEAYQAYLLGRQRLTDRKVDDLADAVQQFARAIELDPLFAGAWSGLADACLLYQSHSGGQSIDHCPPWADEVGGSNYGDALGNLARHALELDGMLGEAWMSLGNALGVQARLTSDHAAKLAKLKEANSAYQRGLSLNPSHVQGYRWYAWSLAKKILYGDTHLGWLDAWKADTWQSVIKQGLEADPLSISLHSVMTDFPMWARTKEEAFYHARRIIEIAPGSATGYRDMGELSWFLSGEIDEAIKWTNRAAEIDPLSYWHPELISYGYATLGDIDMALAYWERAARMLPEDALPKKLHILLAVIWLGRKDGIPIQQVLEALEQVDTTDEERREIEAYLAIIQGEGADWLASHADDLSECLEAEVEVYVDNFRECGLWLDWLLQAAGEEMRVHALLEARIEDGRIWANWASTAIDPRFFVMLGRHDEALDDAESLYIKQRYRGNPYRVYLFESLRFELYHDPILDSIRDHPRFQAIVAEVETDLAQQLENVREMERKGELPTLEQLRAELQLQP